MTGLVTGAGTPARPIVFLHIPKTAGQTIHSELERIVGTRETSPVRVHTQVDSGAAQFPPGHALYSGHIDWTHIDALPAPRFTFTVLRDPLERIASFYFYLLREAEKLGPDELQSPARTGMRMALTRSADDYFFGGDAGWQRFIRDHYDNVYCTYFATRKIRGWKDVAGLERPALFGLAKQGAQAIDRIYSVADLSRLEADIATCTGKPIKVANQYVNAGPDAKGALRWPKLRATFEKDNSINKLRRFTGLDQRLMQRLGLSSEPV